MDAISSGTGAEENGITIEDGVHFLSRSRLKVGTGWKGGLYLSGRMPHTSNLEDCITMQAITSDVRHFVMRATFVIISILSSITTQFAQELDFKREAHAAFEREHYSKAVELMLRALAAQPEDAEIHYYLG